MEYLPFANRKTSKALTLELSFLIFVSGVNNADRSNRFPFKMRSNVTKMSGMDLFY